MDPGSRSHEVARYVSWLGATVLWMLMMLAETGHAFIREAFIGPMIGAHRAHKAGVLIGSLTVLLIAWAGARRLHAETLRSQLMVGSYWVVLTVLFEFSVGRAMGLSWGRLLSDYNPLHSGLMLIGLAVMFAAPWLTGRKS